MNAAPLLSTARFDLWLPQAGDLADLFALTESEKTRRFLGRGDPSMADSFARLHRNAGSWALHGYGCVAVRERGQPTGPLIGNCGVFRSWRDLPGLNDVAEAGWIIHPDWWGKGAAGEVMDAYMAWFDSTCGAQRVGCMIEEGNVASERVAARLGFAEYDRQTGPDGAKLVLYERG